MKIALPLLILCSCMALGCAGRTSTSNAIGPYGVFQNAGVHGVTHREYRVDAPDELLIKAPDVKEIDGQRQVVRPDGKISLELVGEVMVAGKTPVEIADEMKQLVAKYYVKADVRVEVVANSKFFYVFGFGAAKQGKYPYTGRVTVVSALADAGFSTEGWPEQIRLSRPTRNGEPNQTAVIDFTKISGYGDMTQNYLIEDGDIIEIPYSPLAAWNVNINRLLGPFTGSASLVTTPLNAANTFQTNSNRR